MSEQSDQPTGESTAFDSNRHEVINYLGAESDPRDVVENIEGTEYRGQCVMCGSPPVWFTAELREDSILTPDTGQITRFWCDECVPEAFVKLWKKRSATSVEQLEGDSSSSPSDTDHGDGGLLTQQNTVEIVYHLDVERNSIDITGILNYFGITRDEAICCDCEAQADWYHTEIYDLFRKYDFDAARGNSFFCDDCIDQKLLDLWCRQPWTPNQLP